jgi:hypothetical protein
MQYTDGGKNLLIQVQKQLVHVLLIIIDSF